MLALINDDILEPGEKVLTFDYMVSTAVALFWVKDAGRGERKTGQGRIVCFGGKTNTLSHTEAVYFP